MPKLTLSDQVRRAIDASGLSRYRVCQETGLDQGQMSRFMSGRGSISLDTLDRIAELLDLHLSAGKPKKGA